MYTDYTIRCFLGELRFSSEQLDDAEFRRLILAMVNYDLFGEEPQLDGNERILWPYFRRRINQLVIGE